ncbi:MAG TPA: SDR family NAD(P)-dependent oxidoreductase [Solirubrobacterales bacterium]|jgi:NAD(P)-dependent dehydrogenase (short-subunit alcohol dehydrogenase family)|nr:SDR family NAD(P)-dependent oxidoreductase [Solirubrobacterales bacterium]
MPSVLISGASRGIGRATALRLAGAGWTVYGTVRREADGEALAAEAAGLDLHPLRLDVADDAQIAALDGALPARLDAIVNNAGIVVSGPLESLSARELREQFDVNVVGAVALTNLVLPRLREARGRIVFVSSLSGRVSTPMTGAYNASKFAIEAIADAWRLELRPWGIKVILVEPAMTDTDLWRDAPATLESDVAGMSAEHRELYDGHLAGMRRVIPRIQRMAKPVDTVAATIERALTASRPKARYPVGVDVRVQAALSGVTPARVMDALNGRLTGTPGERR